MLSYLSVAVCVGLLLAVYDTSFCHSLSSTSLSRADGLQHRLKQLTAEGGMILLDGDNVRGKTKFQLSKEDLCSSVESWMDAQSLYGQVVLIFDHASKHSAYFLPKSGLSVVFSGPGRTADDVISRDSSWFIKKLEKDLVVVTEDNGLKKRCRTEIKGSASSRGKQQRSKKKPKEIIQVITPSQKILLEKMESEQKQREAIAGDEKLDSEVEVEVEEGEEVIVGSIIKSDDKKEKGEKLSTKDLTFVSSLTFAEMILKINDENKMDKRVEGADSVLVNSEDIKNDAAVPLFYNPLTLVVKGNVHNAELSLLRREVELRKQISGYQTSLLTCNRKAAVKIRVQIATVNARLIDCVNDAIEIKKSNSANVEKVIETDGVTATATAVAVTVADVGSKQGFLGGVVKEEEEEVVITNSVVDRGAELLQSILANGRPLGTIEETWERIILSEKMRFSLQDLYGVENSRNIDIIENARRNSKTVSTANNEAVPTTIETTHSSTYNDKANLPLTYVSYINNCFNSIKRLAAVEKVEKN